MQIKLFQFIIEVQVSEPPEVQNIETTIRSINMNKKKNVKKR